VNEIILKQRLRELRGGSCSLVWCGGAMLGGAVRWLEGEIQLRIGHDVGTGWRRSTLENVTPSDGED
jgi:hypothetical protein